MRAWPLITALLGASHALAQASAIDTAPIEPWLTQLASPAFGGRGTGTAGFERAATLVRDHFAALHLEPLGDDGDYRQAVPWTRTAANPERTRLEVTAGEQSVCILRPGAGLHGLAGFAAQADGGVTVIGYAADDDAFAWKTAEFSGRVVFVHAPSGFGVEPFTRDGQRRLRRLGHALQQAGAAAWIVVSDDMCARIPELAGQSAPGRTAGNPALRASAQQPNLLFTTTARLDEILTAASRTTADVTPGARLDLDVLHAELRLEMLTAAAPACNVIGRLPGSDERLRSEHVVIGCHLDHLGRKDGVLHPGADDDGSGTVGVMALAQAFAADPVRPRRSLVFVAFCGEEVGLIGSDYFTRQPPIPLESIVAELQMDMIGRSEENARRGETADKNRNSLHLIGTEKLSSDLHALCLARNAATAHFDLEWDEEDVFFRSDHFNFARQGVPIAFFFTGFHADYHQPTDTVGKIEFDKLRRVARYVYDVAFELARADDRPHVDERAWQRLGDKRRRRTPAAPLRR